MSTHAARLEHARSTRLRLLLSAEVVAPVALGLFSLALVLVTWNTWGNPGSDTGYDTLAGIRVAHGELPYVDFTYYYGPLAPFALGLASLLGGAGMWPAIGFGLVVALAIVFASYALATSLSGPVGGFLAGALTAAVAFSANELSFVDPHTASATLGVLTALCFLLCLQRCAAVGGRGWLVAAGMCAGLSALTRYEFAVAVFAAAAVWLVLRLRARLSTWSDVGLFAAPALAIPAAVYGAFLTAVSPHRLVFDNLYPSDFLQSTGHVVLRSRMPWTVSSFAALTGKLLLYAVGVTVLLVAARLLERGGRLRQALLAVGVLVGLVAIAAAVANPGALQHGLKFAYGWIPAGAALAAVLLFWRYRRADSDWSAEGQVELALALTLAAVAVTTYSSFYIQAFAPQMAAYMLPLAAPFLAGLHLRAIAPSRTAFVLGAIWLAALAAATTGLAVRDARAETATVHGVGGSLAVRPAESAAYNAAVRAIQTRTRPGEPVLLAPQLTWLYALTERKNPLPQLSLLPGVLASPAAEREAIRWLEAADVKLAVVDVHPFPAYAVGSFGSSFNHILARWIARSFTRVTVVPVGGSDATLEIWSRRGS